MENLGHMGVLGMHWGRRKGGGSKGKVKGSYKERFKRYKEGFKKENRATVNTLNRKKLIKGKSLTRNVLEALGGHAVINLAASTAIGGPAGPTVMALAGIGHLVIDANLVSKVIQRVEQKPNPKYKKK